MPDDLDAIRRITDILDAFSSADRERIVRWVCERDQIPVAIGREAPTPPESESPHPIPLNPHEALRNGVTHGNLSRIRSALQRFREIDAPEGQAAAATALASAGEEDGAQALFHLLSSQDLPDAAKKHAIGGLAQYFVVRDREREGLQTLSPLLHRMAAEAVDESDKAFYLNQLGRLYYSAGHVREALDVQREAAELAPSDPAYQHNLSIIYQALGDLDKAADAASRTLEQEGADVDHLAHAIELLAKRGDVGTVLKAFGRLRELDPQAAQELVASNPALRRRLRHE